MSERRQKEERDACVEEILRRIENNLDPRTARIENKKVIENCRKDSTQSLFSYGTRRAYDPAACAFTMHPGSRWLRRRSGRRRSDRRPQAAPAARRAGNRR